jgi:mRNA-degrading endonuclease RelE of RelBE toxin-antitoxin system
MTKIEFFPNFHKKFKKLNKKNRNLLKDIQELVKVLEADPTTGVYLGNNIYKIRMANSSKNIGKRGGFRVITYYVNENNIVYLVEIYEKNVIENIPLEEIITLVEKELKDIE